MASTIDPEIQRLAALTEKIGVAMLVTRTREGHFVSRPVQQAGFDGALWFFTSAASHKAAEIRAHPQVNVAYADISGNTFVSICGTARVRRERSRIDAMWREPMRVFFPNGKDDPDVTLIRVQIDSAEYWDGPGMLAGKALRLLLATATQDPDLLGENRTLRVDSSGRRAAVVHGNTRGDAARAERKPARKSPGKAAQRKRK